ncbi:serine acetyltransferase [Pedobacter ginsengisoli]|uniref:Serine acetyltransferase n=1 Tax=Pedobacter ginsengisoli TaxID=363852 RepID=A0A2D1U8N4_9SPHI|nr:serine acetyltransferase [Pedobacter ginsengisoli]ATP57961.1 serine acetyltransferase [Pedobacter ginsengisoli]
MIRVFELIKSDLYRYYGKTDKRTFLKSFFLVEGFRFMFFYRIKSTLSKKNPLYWLFYIIVRHYSYKYGFQFFSAKIGKGFYIGHFGNIIINGGTHIGDNVNISPGVVIGQVSRGRLKGVPKIGNNVWIGSNVVIVGNIKVGNNVLIAPGTYVTTDVPDFSLVRGNPCEISSSRGVEGYVCNAWLVEDGNE